MAAAALTAEQKDQARKAAKAEAERKRRADLKVMQAQLDKAGISDQALDAEQKKRAVASAETKKGLTGKALATFILEGKDGKAQVEAAKAAKQAEKKAEKTRQNVTRSADPEATQLAADAKALAPDVRSAFLPKDAREFLDRFNVIREGQSVTVTRTDADAEVTFKTAQLRRFAEQGEKNGEVRAGLSTLAKDTRLWGRKLALFVAVKAAER